MKVNKVADMKVYMVVDLVVGKVANMKVDKVIGSGVGGPGFRGRWSGVGGRGNRAGGLEVGPWTSSRAYSLTPVVLLRCVLQTSCSLKQRDSVASLSRLLSVKSKV